jgi:hypothetical protein
VRTREQTGRIAFTAEGLFLYLTSRNHQTGSCDSGIYRKRLEAQSLIRIRQEGKYGQPNRRPFPRLFLWSGKQATGIDIIVFLFMRFISRLNKLTDCLPSVSLSDAPPAATHPGGLGT